MNIPISQKRSWHHIAEINDPTTYIASIAKKKDTEIHSIELSKFNDNKRLDAFSQIMRFIAHNELDLLTKNTEHSGGFTHDGVKLQYVEECWYGSLDQLTLLNVKNSRTKEGTGIFYSCNIYSTDETIVQALSELMQPFLYVQPDFKPSSTKRARVYMLMLTRNGLQLVPYSLDPRQVDPLYYKENTINDLEDALDKDKPGLIFLSGPPGTGKTNLIYHVASTRDDRFVFIPHSQLGLLGKPEFANDLFELLNHSIVILEDSEGLFKSRDKNGGLDGLSSTLLNLTDGFLGELTKIKVIATQNTTLDIDPAFQRKGRMLYAQTFEELPTEQALKVAEKIGVGEDMRKTIDKNMTLGDLFALLPEEKELTVEKKEVTEEDILERLNQMLDEATMPEPESLFDED